MTAKLKAVNASGNSAQLAGGALFFNASRPTSSLALRWAMLLLLQLLSAAAIAAIAIAAVDPGWSLQMVLHFGCSAVQR